MEALIVLMLLGCIGLSIYFISESRGGSGNTTTLLEKSQVIRVAVQGMAAGTISMRSSWVPTGQGEDYATFLYKRRPSIVVAFILLWFFVIPGILYLVFGGKNQVLNISVFDNNDGTSTAQFAAQGAIARRRGEALLKSLAAHEQAGTQVAAGELAEPPVAR